ncbi:MAG: hypothetical protein WBK88_00070 [Methanothrix sp.]
MRLPLLLALLLLVAPGAACNGECHQEGGIWICPVCPPATPPPAHPNVELSIETYGMDQTFDPATMDANWDLLFAEFGKTPDGTKLPDLWEDLTRLQRGEFRLDELKVVVGIAWGYNVSQEGIVTLPGGETEDLRRWASAES